MIKSTKKAFTLVELIVVITILAILGTIAFISLQSYTADTRNTKRISDVNSIAQKISIEIAKGATSSMFASPNSNVCNSDFGPRAGTGVNFTELNENSDSFKDPKGCDYNYVYGVGTASGTTITGESTQITEQLFQVYTWKENASSGTTISAGRTLTSGDLILN